MFKIFKKLENIGFGGRRQIQDSPPPPQKGASDSISGQTGLCT